MRSSASSSDVKAEDGRVRRLVVGTRVITRYRVDDTQIVIFGGAYGDSAARPRELVREEVRNGIISPESARDVYKLDD